MVSSNFFKDISFAEKSGFGVWYEYLAKFRIFKKFTSMKKVLIFGLPEKYSLGLDTLLFSEYAELHIVDTRKEVLEDYKKYADKFSKNIKIIPLEKMNQIEILKKNKYDLLISTEVLQNDLSLIRIMKDLSKLIIIFVPNKQCYAHPNISHLNSLSLKKLKSLGQRVNLKIIDAGYIDCPPWPAGACLPKSDNIVIKESFSMKIIKNILAKITPLLVKLDNHYLSPWKELNSHMVYCVFKNG